MVTANWRECWSRWCTRVLLNLLLREMMDKDSPRLQVLRGILSKFGGLPADFERKLRHHAPPSAKPDP